MAAEACDLVVVAAGQGDFHDTAGSKPMEVEGLQSETLAFGKHDVRHVATGHGRPILDDQDWSARQPDAGLQNWGSKTK
jgi:hypothetical protein